MIQKTNFTLRDINQARKCTQWCHVINHKICNCHPAILFKVEYKQHLLMNLCITNATLTFTAPQNLRKHKPRIVYPQSCQNVHSSESQRSCRLFNYPNIWHVTRSRFRSTIVPQTRINWTHNASRVKSLVDCSIYSDIFLSTNARKTQMYKRAASRDKQNHTRALLVYFYSQTTF